MFFRLNYPVWLYSAVPTLGPNHVVQADTRHAPHAVGAGGTDRALHPV